MKINFLVTVTAFLIICDGKAFAQAYHPVANLHATLDGLDETPSVNPSGNGSGSFTLNLWTHKLKWKIIYSNLSAAITDARIEGPNRPGTNGGQIAQMALPSDVMIGETLLSQPQMDDILAGKDYVNISTTNHHDGEILGYIVYDNTTLENSITLAPVTPQKAYVIPHKN